MISVNLGLNLARYARKTKGVRLLDRNEFRSSVYMIFPLNYLLLSDVCDTSRLWRIFFKRIIQLIDFLFHSFDGYTIVALYVQATYMYKCMLWPFLASFCLLCFKLNFKEVWGTSVLWLFYFVRNNQTKYNSLLILYTCVFSLPMLMMYNANAIGLFKHQLLIYKLWVWNSQVFLQFHLLNNFE